MKALPPPLRASPRARSTPIKVGDLAVDPLDLPIAEAAYAVVADVVEFAAGPVSVHADPPLRVR